MGDSTVFQGTQVYDCLRCGKCCRAGWRILVEPDRAAYLQGHPLTVAAQKAGYTPLHLSGDGWGVLGTDDNGRCVYFGEGQGCRIHALDGFDRKPRTCRQFPFLPVETPDGIQVGLSFHCSAVQADHGRPVEAHQEDLEALVISGHYPRVGFEGGWDDYKAKERSLLLQLQEAQCVQQLELGHYTQAGLGAAVAYLESNNPAEQAWLRQRVEAGESYLSPRFGVGIRLSAFKDWLPLPPLQRYLSHLVERKFLLLGGPDQFTGRLGFLTLIPSLVALYAPVLAAEPVRGFWASIELVEGEICAHASDNPDLAELFTRLTLL